MDNKIVEFIKKMKINERTINYVLIFVLGFLVGVALKTEAKKRITIGYQDYMTNGMKQEFDLNKPEPAVPAQDQAAPDQNQSQQPQDNASND